MKTTRKPSNYAVTRKQKRAIARRLMKEEGLKHINKEYHYVEMRATAKCGIPKTEPSLFSKKWREYWEDYKNGIINLKGCKEEF